MSRDKRMMTSHGIIRRTFRNMGLLGSIVAILSGVILSPLILLVVVVVSVAGLVDLVAEKNSPQSWVTADPANR